MDSPDSLCTESGWLDIGEMEDEFMLPPWTLDATSQGSANPSEIKTALEVLKDAGQQYQIRIGKGPYCLGYEVLALSFGVDDVPEHIRRRVIR